MDRGRASGWISGGRTRQDAALVRTCTRQSRGTILALQWAFVHRRDCGVTCEGHRCLLQAPLHGSESVNDAPSVGTTRREFCGHACQLASLAAGGVLLTACGGGGSPTSPSPTPAPALSVVQGTVAGQTVSVTVGAGSPLTSVGSAARVQTPIGSFLVSRIGQDSFTTLTSTCTHEACTIDGFNGSRYVCPCHGSQFSTGGAVLNGPATMALRQFPTSFANGVLTFTV